jgi:hypothetical protein
MIVAGRREKTTLCAGAAVIASIFSQFSSTRRRGAALVISTKYSGLAARGRRQYKLN